MTAGLLKREGFLWAKGRQDCCLGEVLACQGSGTAIQRALLAALLCLALNSHTLYSGLHHSLPWVVQRPT